ncbi:TPA: hypothetical protein ACSP2Y_002864, partial [Aeromonas veronii]
QAGFFDPSSLFLSQIRRSLRRFYACHMALYGAFTPVLHTLFSVNDTNRVDMVLHRLSQLIISMESI